MGVTLGDNTKNPYGLIGGTARREGAPDAERAFDQGQGW